MAKSKSKPKTNARATKKVATSKKVAPAKGKIKTPGGAGPSKATSKGDSASKKPTTKAGEATNTKKKVAAKSSKPIKSAKTAPPAAKKKGPVAKTPSKVTKPAAKSTKPKVASKSEAAKPAKTTGKPPKVAPKSSSPASKGPAAAKAAAPKLAPKTLAPKKGVPAPSAAPTKPEIVAKIRSAQANKEARKDLAQETLKPSLVPNTPVPTLEKGKDRLILMVRDAYWLHAHWDITRQTVERARVSIAENWHNAKPVVRMLKLEDNGTTNNAETVFKDIEIHGGVRNWYIEVETPGSSFKIQLGYLTANGRFYELIRSNTVTMPVAGSKEVVDDHWADIAKDAERIYAMSGGYNEDTQSGDLEEVFEERLKRSMDVDVLSQFGSGAEGSLKRSKQFFFDVDAELIVFGNTHADAHVNVGGEPVKVRSDGSFSIRLPLPDRRQVLPATARSRDGVDEQTVVIAVERNTKVMEPLSLDVEDL